MVWTKGPPLYVSAESMLANDGSFVWYCIPKNGSRSLVAALAGRARKLSELSPGGGTRQVLAALPPPGFSFAFMRGPFARVRSAWLNKVHAPPDTPAQARLFEKNRGLRAGMGLDAFVGWLGEALERTDYLDQHWRPQAHFVCDADGRLCVDLVGTVETLEADMARIAAIVGAPAEVPHLNAGSSPPAETAFSAGSRAIIERVYARDFELLSDLAPDREPRFPRPTA
jgi:hypothetical protein